MNIVCILSAALLSASDPLDLPSYEQAVTAEFATESDAAAAALEIAPLPDGAELAFTSRWDDSTGAHLARARMFAGIGMNATFFLNGNEEFFRGTLPRLQALGSRFGNHTTRHPYLMESGINRIFSEVMENKIAVECASGETVTSFVIPFNWACALEPSRAAKLGRILVETGHFVSSDWPREEVAQPPERWMAGHTFSSNDRAPDAKAFEKGLANAVAAVKLDPRYPKVTYGIHSWCDAEGLKLQGSWLRSAIAAHPEWWVTDDSRYGAYRYEYLHHGVAEKSVEGRKATFRLRRFDPAFLGAAEPLTVRFGPAPVRVSVDGAAVAADAKGYYPVAHAAAKGLPAKIARELPGVRFTLVADERRGAVRYSLEGVEGPADFVFNPAPMWERGRVVMSGAPHSGEVKLGARNLLPDYQEGDRLYAASADFVKDGRRMRLYATVKVEGGASATGGTPRDAVQVLGPLSAEAFVEADWLARSLPGKELPDSGEGVTGTWRSMADPDRVGFSAAAYIPWAKRETQAFKDAVNAAFKTKDSTATMLAAADFVCPAAGEKDLLVYDVPGFAHTVYLNGVKTVFKGNSTRIKVNAGLNRVIIRWNWFQPNLPQALLLSVCDDGDVNKAVEFRKPTP